MTSRQRQWVDLFRAVGILRVLAFHVFAGIMIHAPSGTAGALIGRVPGWMTPLWQAGGADMIFTTSAFLIGLSLMSEWQDSGRISFRIHAVRRISRILPLYWLALLFYAAVGEAGGTEFWLSAVFLGFTFGNSNVIPVGWSMEVIIQVYIALPFVVTALMRSRSPWIWIALSIIATAGLRYVYLELSSASPRGFYEATMLDRVPVYEAFSVYYRPWFRLTPFLVGLALALAVHRGTRPRARPFLWLLAGLMFWFGAALPVHDPNSWIYLWTGERFWTVYWAFCHSAVSIGTALLLWLLLTGRSAATEGAAPLPLLRFWQPFSKVIFGIYLFHFPMIALAAVVVYRSTDPAALAATGTWHVLATGSLAALLSLGLSILIYRYFERPVQNRLRDWLTPRPAK